MCLWWRTQKKTLAISMIFMMVVIFLDCWLVDSFAWSDGDGWLDISVRVLVFFLQKKTWLTCKYNIWQQMFCWLYFSLLCPFLAYVLFLFFIYGAKQTAITIMIMGVQAIPKNLLDICVNALQNRFFLAQFLQ